MNVFAVAAGAEDDSVVLAAMTGSGDFYCSGNDLGNFMNITPDQMAEHAVKGTSQEWEYTTCHWHVHSQSTHGD